ncbi:MAG: hypothetical protein ACOCRO_10570 [Halanaerobiales bacterium]
MGNWQEELNRIQESIYNDVVGDLASKPIRRERNYNEEDLWIINNWHKVEKGIIIENHKNTGIDKYFKED